MSEPLPPVARPDGHVVLETLNGRIAVLPDIPVCPSFVPPNEFNARMTRGTVVAVPAKTLSANTLKIGDRVVFSAKYGHELAQTDEGPTLFLDYHEINAKLVPIPPDKPYVD